MVVSMDGPGVSIRMTMPSAKANAVSSVMMWFLSEEVYLPDCKASRH
tara:strand:+ start:4992 stop:5132 length:141 start_codon:yes stop_codon:yes gene_type:complete